MACQGVRPAWALLGLLQEVLGCLLKRKNLCRWYLLLEVFPGRGEEAETQAVGAGQRSNLGRKTESFQRSPVVSTLPPGLPPGVSTIPPGLQPVVSTIPPGLHPTVGTIPPGLQPGVGKCVVAGVAPGPSLQPVGSLLIFRSLGWEGWRRLRNNQPGSQPAFT